MLDFCMSTAGNRGWVVVVVGMDLTGFHPVYALSVGVGLHPFGNSITKL